MNKIILLLVAALFPISLIAQSKLSDNFAVIDSLVNAELSKKTIPSIAIGIVKDGKAVFARGYGFANVEEKIPADKNTIYQLGSVSKMLTGNLLAQFVTNNKMSLTDTLASYFTSIEKFPVSPTGQVVTIRDIATHSAEFPRYPENLYRIDPDPIKGYSFEEMIKGIEAVKIEAPIGERYNYSNFGYGVLGTAMANHTNKKLSELFNEYIFAPLGMKTSSLVIDHINPDKLAIPYLEVSPLQQTEPWDMGTLSGAGNVFSSVEDMNKFMVSMIMENDVSKIQQAKYLKINETWSYGLGCFIIDSKKEVQP